MINKSERCSSLAKSISHWVALQISVVLFFLLKKTRDADLSTPHCHILSTRWNKLRAWLEMGWQYRISSTVHLLSQTKLITQNIGVIVMGEQHVTMLPRLYPSQRVSSNGSNRSAHPLLKCGLTFLFTPRMHRPLIRAATGCRSFVQEHLTGHWVLTTNESIAQ